MWLDVLGVAWLIVEEFVKGPRDGKLNELVELLGPWLLDELVIAWDEVEISLELLDEEAFKELKLLDEVTLEELDVEILEELEELVALEELIALEELATLEELKEVEVAEVIDKEDEVELEATDEVEEALEMLLEDDGHVVSRGTPLPQAPRAFLTQ